MSRIGRMPVAIPAGVTVEIAEGNKVTVKGPKGTLVRELPHEMEIKIEDGHVIVSRPNDLKRMKSLHGLTRTLIHNMTIGVSEGYTKTLEVNGVGYRAAKAGKKRNAPVEVEEETLIDLVENDEVDEKALSQKEINRMKLAAARRRDAERYGEEYVEVSDEDLE